MCIPFLMILVMLGNIKLVDLSKLACATKLLKTLQISEVHTVPACGYYVNLRDHQDDGYGWACQRFSSAQSRMPVVARVSELVSA